MEDPDLQGSGYVGEFVISADMIYLVKPSGDVEEVMRTEDILK